MDNFCLRQIRVPNELYKAIKIYCIKNCITLKKFYDEMMDWFLVNNRFSYQASYKKGQIMSLWLPKNKLIHINKLATIANVSEARVVFTALVEYTAYRNIYRHNHTLDTAN